MIKTVVILISMEDESEKKTCVAKLMCNAIDLNMLNIGSCHSFINK